MNFTKTANMGRFDNFIRLFYDAYVTMLGKMWPASARLRMASKICQT